MGRPMFKQFMVFCQHTSGHGPVWIDKVEVRQASDGTYPIWVIEEAAQVACAKAWNNPDHREIHLMGVANANTSILHWDDSHLE